jgi:hypothetical protein
MNIFANNNIGINTNTNAGFRLDVNGTARVQGRITNVAPAIAATRETLYRGSVSDNTNDAFIIANGTSADSVFAPNFVGFNQSSQLLWGLGFTGLLTSTNDASDSSVFGVIRFNAARTDNAADPINGTFTSIANRKLFTFENNAVPIGTIFRTGNWLIQNGGTTTDAGFRLDVNGTARVQGALTLTPSASSNYQINSSVFSGRLGFQNLNTIQDCFIDLFSNATGNRSVGFAVWAKGIPTSSTNIELLEFRYDATNTRFALNILQGGTGVLRPFHIYTGENTNQLKIQTNGNVSINSASDVASAQLQIDSTARGFLPPRMTATQRNAITSPAAGLIVYDTTLNKLSLYTGLVWETITSI